MLSSKDNSENKLLQKARHSALVRAPRDESSCAAFFTFFYFAFFWDRPFGFLGVGAAFDYRRTYWTLGNKNFVFSFFGLLFLLFPAPSLFPISNDLLSRHISSFRGKARHDTQQHPTRAFRRNVAISRHVLATHKPTPLLDHCRPATSVSTRMICAATGYVDLFFFRSANYWAGI